MYILVENKGKYIIQSHVCLIVYVSQNLGCKPSEKLDKESKKGWGQGKILRSKVYHECFC